MMKTDCLPVARMQRSEIRGIRALKNPVLHFVSYGLLTFNCLASSDLPDMQMHIFDSGMERVETSSDMKMVIFSDDASSLQRDEPQGENLRLAYSEDGQVSVYSDSVVEESFVDDEQGFDIEFYIDGGYRQDKLDWNIASSGQIILDIPRTNPNIISELNWDNIEIATIELGASMRLPSNFIFDAKFAYGQVFDGENQDSDFLGDNRTLEFSRSNNNADEGSTIDLSMSLGYQLDFGVIDSTPIVSFIPKVGYSYYAQNFKMTNGYQTVSRPDYIDYVNDRNRAFDPNAEELDFGPPNLGNFGGLDSSYEGSWHGPWAGIDSQINIGKYVSLLGSFEYHYAFYEATADWNLREDLAHPESYTQEAEGTGFNISLGSEVRVNDALRISLSVDYKKWDADKNGSTTFFGSGGGIGETFLNEVNWESMGANVGLQYQF